MPRIVLYWLQVAPTAIALRKLLAAICEEYATEYGISFNATELECLIEFPNSHRHLRNSLTDCTFCINNQPIEFVESFKTLAMLLLHSWMMT
jgi:hypothetical protein